jgi:hypothetical protein
MALAKVQKDQKTRRQQLEAIVQTQPRSTKKPRTNVPPPQSARIMQRYVSGESIREIAREERRDRATVTKIVRSDEMNAVVQKMRATYYALGFDALNAVQHTLQVRKDGGLGRHVLSDIGVIPSPEERHAIASQPDRAALTPFETAVAEDENGQINRVAYGMACAIEESARCFGTPLPTADEHRHLRRVAMIADKIAGGRFSEICANDSAAETRIRQLAEKMVRREEPQRLLSPRRVQRALPHEKQAALVGQVTSRN